MSTAVEAPGAQPGAPQNDVRRLETTREQTDALAERIARVLRERKKAGAERRMHELEAQRRNSQRALARYRELRAAHLTRLGSLSPDLRENCRHRIKSIDAAYEAVISSNAAPKPLGELSS